MITPNKNRCSHFMFMIIGFLLVAVGFLTGCIGSGSSSRSNDQTTEQVPPEWSGGDPPDYDPDEEAPEKPDTTP